MKLDKICRTCLLEKSTLKPLFGACVTSMLMSCASVQIIEGDGLPCQICTQCLQTLSRSYAFKQLCEKSENTLRQYMNSISLDAVTLDNESILSGVKTDQLLSSSEVLQESCIFQDIFNDATTHSLVDTFHNQNENAVVSDLAETMQSLQTIAEQCLPETWETDTQLVSCHSNSQHTNNFAMNNLYRCQFCEDILKDEWSLGEHIKIHAGQATKYFCSVCGKECQNAAALEKHLIEHTTQNSTKCFICNICDHYFADEEYLKQHQKDAHFNVLLSDLSDLSENDLKYVCTVCNKSFKRNSLLTQHMRTHTGERPLACEICNKTFALSSSLYKHKLIHTSEKLHACSICGRKFMHRSNLLVHVRLHTAPKEFMCNICGKSLSTRASRDMHVRTHTGERPYTCTTCLSSFPTPHQLKLHTLKHTGNRAYSCWHCGKTFARKDTRDTHVRSHTGERPYACTVCTKKYMTAAHLRAHIRTAHSDEKKHQCTVCLKSFAEKKVLRQHVKTHTGEKPHRCQFCEARFVQKHSLDTHVKNKHTFFEDMAAHGLEIPPQC